MIVSTQNISDIENGFATDVIVFTGKESTVFKIAHINRFSGIGIHHAHQEFECLIRDSWMLILLRHSMKMPPRANIRAFERFYVRRGINDMAQKNVCPIVCLLCRYE